MNTLIFETSYLSLDQILATAKEKKHYWEKVKKEDFDPEKWTLGVINLENCTIPPEAREEAALFLQSGLYVKEWIVADEVEKHIEIPWKAIGTVVGVIAFVAGAMILLPVVLMGLLVMGLLATDPVLIAVVSTADTKEDTWISIHRWVH